MRCEICDHDEAERRKGGLALCDWCATVLREAAESGRSAKPARCANVATALSDRDRAAIRRMEETLDDTKDGKG